MPFNDKLKNEIDEYVKNHLPEHDDVLEYFEYINDKILLERVKTEYVNARYLYKLFEGMGAIEKLQYAQVRLQMIMYTSIYEAIVHYLLFDLFKNDQEVLKLKNIEMLKQVDIPKLKYNKIRSELSHDGKDLIICYKSKKSNDITKIRFDSKCEALEKMGIISTKLRDSLIEFYSIRNAVHIHAELRKSIVYELEMSKKAFRTLKDFNKEIFNGIIAKKLNDNCVSKIAPINKINKEIVYIHENDVYYGKWAKTKFRIEKSLLDALYNDVFIDNDWVDLGDKENTSVGVGNWINQNLNKHERFASLYSAFLLLQNKIEIKNIDGKYKLRKLVNIV